jgi:catechol 2,3-dioxygenase-like lactoylglutathione lyase family enzyme
MIPELLVIPVSDLAMSRAFYEKTFGFHVVAQVRRAANAGGFIDMQVPGTPLTARISDEGDMPLGSAQGAILTVTDIEAARSYIAARGAAIGAAHAEWGTNFTVADPDGNRWIIRQG